MRKHSKEYDDYMKFDEWAERCNQRLEIAGHKCEMRGRLEKISKGLQIHHISYKNLGREDVGNKPIYVCSRYYLMLHRYYNRRRE